GADRDGFPAFRRPAVSPPARAAERSEAMIETFRSVAGRRPRVVIIGGGLAGLSAAEAIARSGAEAVVTVLESRRITGGRAGSFLDPLSGQSIDYCQHVAMGCCTNLLSLLEACGLSDTLAC